MPQVKNVNIKYVKSSYYIKEAFCVPRFFFNFDFYSMEYCMWYFASITYIYDMYILYIIYIKCITMYSIYKILYITYILHAYNMYIHTPTFASICINKQGILCNEGALPRTGMKENTGGHIK